ncbi:fimbria/pilus outer membrane usher protein [Silvimonas sp. JCM 19000]
MDLPHDVYPEVTVNGTPTRSVAHFLEYQGELMVRRKDLEALGIIPPASITDDSATISLDQLSEITYDYQSARQTLDIKVPETMLQAVDISRVQPRLIPASSGVGMVINYDLFSQGSGGVRDYSLWSEARAFAPLGVASTTGTLYDTPARKYYLRFDTTLSHSDPEKLTTLRVGDAVSSSLDWTRAVRLGGVQYQRNFSLRPDLITFPVPALGGSTAVPSSVDVYINSMKQYSGDVPAGPFVTHDPPGIVGAGNATVVVKDAQGREVTTTVPIYIDTRLLNAGLSSFSAETGFVRQNYGLTSFDYDYGHPALSATGRYGYSSNITVEGHTELTRGLANAGAGVLVKLGNAGVINGAVSASGGELSGLQLKLGYQLITPRFSVTVQTQRATPRFGDLAAVTGSPILLETDQIALSLPLFGHQTVSVSLVQQHQSGQAITRLGSLSYNAEITRNIGFLLSLYRDFAGSGESGGYASLNFALPNQITASASLSTANGQKSWGLNAARPADYSGGLGWALQDNNNSGSPYQQARANYLGRYGEVLGAVENSNGTHNYSLDINGALVWMDSDVIAARRISDAFALVSTDGMEGVQVLHEYRPLGVTNSNGHLLVPDLIAWQNNHVGINGVNLPADARLTTTESDIVPQAGSGAMAYFPVTRYRAATVILHDSKGNPLPAGLGVRDLQSGREFVVGFDGVAFIEGLVAHNTLRVDDVDLRCEVAFDYAPTPDNPLPTLGPLTCHPVSGN